MKRARQRLIFVIGIFWVSVMLIVASFISLHLWAENSLDIFAKSISWYVGRRAWSAGLFLVVNFVVAICLGQVLWRIGERLNLPRVYFVLTVLLAVSLVWLSAFPLGYFDSAASKSVVSYLHEIGSRTMFFVMAVIMTLLVMKVENHKKLRLLSVLFATYAMVCAIAAVVGCGWFSAGILLFESFYILSFMMLLLGYCQIVSK